MISAVDSSVILDVLTDDSNFSRQSEKILNVASTEGQLLICESVLAEIYPALGSAQNCDVFLKDWNLRFIPSSRESAELAGATFMAYISRGGARRRVVADFLIAAHAQIVADRLITRDRGFTRNYFRSLVVVSPSPTL
jgi:predicted nucleic acid-binding protein